jgi:colanic acid biosynthesis glycosyl transferase WcaI
MAEHGNKNSRTCMRFLILGLNFSPELIGIGKYTGEMVEYLVARGHTVRVVTAPPYYPQWQVKQGYSAWRYHREDWRGAQVFRCPIWVPRKTTGLKRLVYLSSFAISSLPVMLAQVRWKPDIVFCVAPALLAAPVAILTARLAGCKSWLHVQDFELETALNLGMVSGWGGILTVAKAFEALLLKSFDRVSTISRRMLERLCQKGVRPEKCVLFPNWVDGSKIYPCDSESNSLRAELNLTKDQLIVLYSGNMGRKQGIEILVDAAHRLENDPQIQLVLCGDGAVRADLEQRASGLRNIHFLPLRPLDGLNELLNAGNIHVLPQRAGAADLVMPSKLTGMLASGRPVIATAAAGTELAGVVGQVGVVVPSGDADCLAQSIRDLAADPDERARLGKLGRAFVEENWSNDRVLGNFLAQVNDLVHQPV